MRRARKFIPALISVSGACVLTLAPAAALELGDIQVQSTLGQPLRASIPYLLAPHEQLTDDCVSLRPIADTAFVPTVSKATISVTDKAIVLSGDIPIRDPLLTMRLAIDCAYTPHLSRQFTLIVDPVLPERSAPALASVAPAALLVADAVPRTAAVRVPERTSSGVTPAKPRPAVDRSPVNTRSEYRVQTGDTVSAIVARIAGRAVSLGSAISLLVAANPDAFIDGNPDRLIAGSVLSIPDFDVPQDAEPTTQPLPNDDAPPSPTAVPTAVPTASATVEEEPVEPAQNTAIELDEPAPAIARDTMSVASDVPIAPQAETIGATDAAAPDPTDNLRPGDIIVAPRAASSSSDPVASRADRDAPAATVPRVSRDTDSQAGDWRNFALPTGAGIAMAFILFFAGRALKTRFGSVPVGAPMPAAPAQDDDPTEENAIIGDVDFEFGDTIAADAISLDADLDAGTGLQDGGAMDVAQDFGFGATSTVDTDFDFEITEAASREPEKSETDVIAPSHRLEEPSILEMEVPPEDDDYDLSMIVDATKQSIDDYDATAKDLQAVPLAGVFDNSEYSISDDTLNHEVDLETLERDYEEEFTATLALNEEIEKAARELAERLDDNADDVSAVDFELEPTAQMPASEIDFELEPTAQMPAREEDPDMTAEVTARIATDGGAVNDDIADDDVTSKMLAAGSDVTVEMPRDTDSKDRGA